MLTEANKNTLSAGGELILGGNSFKLQLQLRGVEENLSLGYPYKKEYYNVSGELGKIIDCAILNINQGGVTQPRQSLRKDQVLAIPLEGEGRFVSYSNEGLRSIDLYPNMSYPIEYLPGMYYFWRAHPQSSIKIVELYVGKKIEVSDFRRVNMLSIHTPAEFRDAFYLDDLA